MKVYNFDEIIERRGTDSLKYDRLEAYFGKRDLMPFWVADMDFRTPDFILDAIKQRCEHPVFGYTHPSDAYADSIIRWVNDLHGWEIRREWISFIPGVVKGIALAVEHFSGKGDKIVIQPPVYHPFRIVPDMLQREVVYNPLRMVNNRYEMDLEHLESILDKKCKILILSNPHNPAGIVWPEETLRELAKICAKHGVLVISDEIHSEMVYPPFTHHPFATVSDEAAACSITFSAPSKTFNIAGIVASYAIVPDERLRKEFYTFLHAGEFHEGTIFSYIATIAAYTHGAEWRRQMLDYVMGNVRLADEFIKTYLPEIKVYPPQASFLIWLDCRDSGLSHRELVRTVRDDAGLALNEGMMFGKEGEGFLRMNAGCPRAWLEKGLCAMKDALLRHTNIK
ncbi:MAG: PatB family C-S lyase [Tannerella sp.]|jgi:cystathionine beta-lyase|nr:PatB family C-S lyase [Tannerella sp.]